MRDSYESPLCGRYADDEMKRLFSDQRKFSTWRRLWLILAECERELGIRISVQQLSEMRSHLDDIDFDAAAAHEREVRHDVMAHVLAFGDCCPDARPIIHLGATSCYVGDNTDILNMRDGLRLIRRLLLNAIQALSDFAEKHSGLPTLGYTHFQAAQPTTVGKRACLWINDLMTDLEQVDFQLKCLKPLGCRGATGTGASFLNLFDGDADKVERLEKMITERLGFDACQPVSGQTYTRKTDFAVLQALSGIAQSASKFATDVRLLCHLKEIDEPFESGQIGSSAMAYKRNPMRCERICALSRYLICDLQNAAVTASAQWLERTLDDSANRRIAIPEAFLAADAVLNLVINVARGMTVYPAVCRRHLEEELPFMATENILMHCVLHKGADRQALHERIRRHAMKAAEQVKLYGAENDLLRRIRADEAFGLTDEDLNALLDPEAFTGMAKRQCEQYLDRVVRPVLDANREEMGVTARIDV